MNKDIIEILEKSEEIKFEVKSTEDYKYYFIWKSIFIMRRKKKFRGHLKNSREIMYQ